MNYLKLYIIVSFLNGFLFLIFSKFNVKIGIALIQEGGLIENISAILFVTAFLISLIHWPKIRKEKEARMLGFIGILGLIGFLDEISFGERLFDLTMPVIYEVKIDGLHDFFYLGYMYVKDNVNIPTIYLVLIVIVGFSILSVILLRHKQKLLDFVLSRRVHPHHLLIGIAGILIFAALIVDLDIIHWQKRSWQRYWVLLEEVMEMNAALALVFANLCIVRLVQR